MVSKHTWARAALAVLCLLAASRAQAASIVQRSGADFACAGSAYRFVGVNLRGVAHRGTAEMQEQLASANAMNARVVRVFIAQNGVATATIQQRLNDLINVGRGINPELKYIVTFTDFYATGHNPNGDAGYYVNGLLRGQWFRTDFRTNYKPFVGAIVGGLTTAPEIFAWELGNELQADNADEMLAFAYEMGYYVKGLGAQQMVTTGFISSHHAAKGLYGGRTLDQLVDAFYRYWPGYGGSNKNSPFGFVSLHGYNAAWKAAGAGDQAWNDYNWARTRMPYVVGEIGFSGGFPGGSGACANFAGDTWDGISLPATTSGRGTTVQHAVDHFVNDLGADGVMQWGFMVGSDNGEGDRCFGLDTAFHTDWSAVYGYYQAKGASLPGCGSGGSCTASVPTTAWKGEYFPNATLSGAPTLVRNDGTGNVYFTWGSGGPNTCGIGADNFSARWTRTVSFSAGTWRFSVTSDDGFRLYVDNVLKLDRWFDQAPTTYTVDVPLAAGNHTVRLQWYERGGGATAQLSWALVGSGGGNNASILTGQSSVPSSLTPGQVAQVRVRVQNTGGTTWTSASLYRLGAQSTNQLTWRDFNCGGYSTSPSNSRSFLCNNVGPNGTYDFVFNVQAPSSPGSYTFSVRMVQDGVEWFGGTAAWTITVGGGNPYPGCPCTAGFDNYCNHPPRTNGCPMTFGGGYCDPNGDLSYSDADWVRGYYEFQDYCR